MGCERNGPSYREAGVDIDRGQRLVARIKSIARRCERPGMLGALGGFGALFELAPERYRRPVLVSGTDGVGTKLRLAIDHGRHRGVGIDLVAMCVNDVVTLGAEPLFFLDYLATGRLDEDVAAEVITGIVDGCEQAGAGLVGGETAEMPGMYAGADYDLAGFCVGVVEHDEIVDGRAIRVGHRLIGLASSGPHANGYSLIRKVLSMTRADVYAQLDGSTLLDALLEPTRIYASSVRSLLAKSAVGGIAHITGGGLVENIPRVMPAGTRAVIDPGAWPRPAVFDWLENVGGIEAGEMYRTFNCGLGMVLFVGEDEVEPALATLTASGERAWDIGRVERSEESRPSVALRQT